MESMYVNGKEIDGQTFVNRCGALKYPMNNQKFQKQSRSLLT